MHVGQRGVGVNNSLAKRLNQVFDRLTSDQLLSGRGLGNEIAFYLFDYPAEAELEVRQFLVTLTGRIASEREDLGVTHLDLLDEVFAYLESRRLLEKSEDLEKRVGTEQLLKNFAGVVSAQKLADWLVAAHELPKQDLVLLSGVGRIWPMVRAHSLLNCLHALMTETPLVLFYPGEFDGTSLRLFGDSSTSSSAASDDPYYRAFSLVS